MKLEDEKTKVVLPTEGMKIDNGQGVGLHSVGLRENLFRIFPRRPNVASDCKILPEKEKGKLLLPKGDQGRRRRPSEADSLIFSGLKFILRKHGRFFISLPQITDTEARLVFSLSERLSAERPSEARGSLPATSQTQNSI